MFRSFFRVIFSIIGAVVGYGLSRLTKFILIQTGVVPESGFAMGGEVTLIVIFAIIFFILFFMIAPPIMRRSEKVLQNIESDMQGRSPTDIIAGTIGLVAGLVIAFLISNVYDYIEFRALSLGLTLFTYLFFGYTGVVIATRRNKDVITLLMRESRDSRHDKTKHGKHSKYPGAVPKILDTSVIIDGRILDILRTGFIEGQIVIPDFVLVELRHIADSSDSMKRKRGRRGLDVLNDIQNEIGVDIYDTSREKSLAEIPEVDVKLLKLAQILGGMVVTIDFNLNKVAGINNVGVLNINELANTLKPIVLTGV